MLGVEGRIDEVEAEGPEQHAGPEEQGWQVKDATPNGCPCADGGLSEGESDEEVGERGEPFGERVKADEDEHHGRQGKAKCVESGCAVCCS